MTTALSLDRKISSSQSNCQMDALGSLKTLEKLVKLSRLRFEIPLPFSRALQICSSIDASKDNWSNFRPCSHVSVYLWISNLTFRIPKFPFPHAAYSNQLACPHASDGIRICLVRDWTRCFCHRSRKYPDPPPSRFQIRCRFIYFYSEKRVKKYLYSLPNSPNACGRKPYPERKSCRGYV